jgi:hypothetical protein
MTDIEPSLAGKSIPVQRAFRNDFKANASLTFNAFEGLVLLSDKDSVDVIQPGMLCQAINSSKIADRTRAECLTRADQLAIFLVLEIIQPVGVGAGEPDVLVLRARRAEELFDAATRAAHDLQDCDYVLGDQAIYIPADSLLASMAVTVERRDPAAAFLAALVRTRGAKASKLRRANVAAPLRLEKLTSTGLADLCLPDVIEFFCGPRLAATLCAANNSAEQSEARCNSRKRTCSQISDSEEDDIDGFAIVSAASTPPAPAPAPAPAEPAKIAALDVLPQVLRTWPQHQAALQHAIVDGLRSATHFERLLHSSDAWRAHCQRTEHALTQLDPAFVTFVLKSACEHESAIVDFYARHSASIDPFVKSFLATTAYIALCAVDDFVPAALRLRINERRFQIAFQ